MTQRDVQARSQVEEPHVKARSACGGTLLRSDRAHAAQRVRGSAFRTMLSTHTLRALLPPKQCAQADHEPVFRINQA
jgi:hypothetical protein